MVSSRQALGPPVLELGMRVPDFLFRVVYFSRGPLPTKKGERRALLGDLDTERFACELSWAKPQSNQGPFLQKRKTKCRTSGKACVFFCNPFS